MATSSQSAAAAVDSFAIARELLLEGAGLELAALDRALSAAMVRKLDYVDLYLQLTRYETWTVEDGIVKEGAYSIDQGIGVRAVSGERTGFAYSDQLDEAALTDAVLAARGIARAAGGSQKIAARATSHRPLYPSGDPLHSMADADKVALLADLDRRVRAMDSRVAQVIGSLSGVYEVVLVQATDGTLAADVRPLVRLNVSVIMERTAGGSRVTPAAVAAVTTRC
jgi:TldD protein